MALRKAPRGHQPYSPTAVCNQCKLFHHIQWLFKVGSRKSLTNCIYTKFAELKSSALHNDIAISKLNQRENLNLNKENMLVYGCLPALPH